MAATFVVLESTLPLDAQHALTLSEAQGAVWMQLSQCDLLQDFCLNLYFHVDVSITSVVSKTAVVPDFLLLLLGKMLLLQVPYLWAKLPGPTILLFFSTVDCIRMFSNN